LSLPIYSLLIPQRYHYICNSRIDQSSPQAANVLFIVQSFIDREDDTALSLPCDTHFLRNASPNPEQ
jgi:hypothetical protein